MQFAVPPRKSYHTPPYARSSRVSLQRRKQLKVVAIAGLGLLALFFLISRIFSSSSSDLDDVSIATSGVVIVTVLDHALYSENYLHKIIQNREDYARRHGYTNFIANVSDYESALDGAPRSWAMVPALRHAMASHSHSKYFFHLGPHALIMNPSISLESHVLDSKRIESLMMKDVSVVPPDSIIKTFSHLKSNDVDVIFTQDKQDISPDSFIIKQGEFARFFLDVWFDPLYRKYNFAKAEIHALDHIVQWHPTILARLALVPQRILNAYSRDSPQVAVDGAYTEGDFVIQLSGCASDAMQSCEKEIEPYYATWTKKFRNEQSLLS
ncbi:hypothetical protein ASPZODRAFT_154010 [Penicilliopsis zonata CBS 506.65]|uniref:Alpha-1,6-mannosyltransferase subunit n=1 Tax=Penicilliopsis zonata CBS 506.65 TaxID=1073090 RepID=A0A1L9SA31_9EURO|nr:hypothetical protein ASPZODRAFT_154010 [Penicilliopsis zonata CBS 506.65]OJJ44035.1 hypothetical protein ASPZODRAFT_154010 [Penicilliopsis zonata CBS 506.65]